jgi:hypothetical protein
VSFRWPVEDPARPAQRIARRGSAGDQFRVWRGAAGAELQAEGEPRYTGQGYTGEDAARVGEEVVPVAECGQG